MEQDLLVESLVQPFSKAIKTEYAPNQGRYVIATKEIDPGEVTSLFCF